MSDVTNNFTKSLLTANFNDLRVVWVGTSKPAWVHI